jgi:iron complex transport system substrate-binding protein
MHRRHFLTALGGVALASTLPGCASSSSDIAAEEAPTPSTGAGFPAVVKHRFGTSTVTSAPTRVLTLGQTDHDAAIALGVVPVAVSGFLGSSYSPFRPWNSAGLTTRPPVLNMLEIQFEKVAALQPDLILAVMSGLTKQDYAKLSAIAPTVAPPVGYEDWAVPFRPHTELIGAALGQPAAARKLVVELETAFAAVREKHPVLVGKHAVCAELWGADFDVLGSGAPRTQFLTDIGLRLSSSLATVAGKGYNAPLSAEKVDLLDDVDVVVWTTDDAKTADLLQHKLVRTLRTTREGRYVLAANGGNDDLLYSMDWGSILSNRWAIDNALPRILRALDGDPGTDPNADS